MIEVKFINVIKHIRDCCITLCIIFLTITGYGDFCRQFARIYSKKTTNSHPEKREKYKKNILRTARTKWEKRNTEEVLKKVHFSAC